MNTAVNSPGIGATEERRLQEAVGELQQLYRGQLVAVFLYGSAARGDFIPGRSDLNLLIVLQSLRRDDLRRGAQLFRRWKKLGVTPLLLTASEVRLASRVFPLELSDIKESGRLLHGSNLLAAIHVESDHVLAQCRRELHGRLIRLRQEYLELGDRRNALAGILPGALTSLLPVFRALLRLSGSPIPTTDEAMVDAFVGQHHLDKDLFTALIEHKRGSRQFATADLEQFLGRLIVEWERLIELVDAA